MAAEPTRYLIKHEDEIASVEHNGSFWWIKPIGFSAAGSPQLSVRSRKRALKLAHKYLEHVARCNREYRAYETWKRTHHRAFVAWAKSKDEPV